MLSPDYIRRKKESFRFFDDLHPAVRQALREANYEWDVVEAMGEQHKYYGNGQPLEELAALYRRKDAQRFHDRMWPKLNSDEFTTGNG